MQKSYATNKYLDRRVAAQGVTNYNTVIVPDTNFS